MPLASVKWPPQLADLSKVPDLVTSVGAKVNVTGGPRVTLAIRANDEAAAGQLSEIIDKLLAAAHERIAEQTAQGLKSSDPVEQAGAKYGQRMSERLLPLLRPVKKGNNLTLDVDLGKNPQLTSITTIGVLMGLAMPAAQIRPRGRPEGAVHEQHEADHVGDAQLQFSPRRIPRRANFDKQGKPLLSWRVHILPYFGLDVVYQQFHLDEPWDSPHNRKLSEILIPVYQNPDQPSKPGMASYLAVCGKGLAFDGEKGRKLGDFTDGLRNTIMLVEADPDRAVIWTKPDDWEYDAKQPLAGLGSASGRFQRRLRRRLGAFPLQDHRPGSVPRLADDRQRRGEGHFQARAMTKLIVGCGYLGGRVARLWRAEGHAVVAVSRHAEKGDCPLLCEAPEGPFRQMGTVPFFLADVTRPETLAGLPAAETVLFAVGYDPRGGHSRREVYIDGPAQRAGGPAARHRPLHPHQLDRRLWRRRRRVGR